MQCDECGTTVVLFEQTPVTQNQYRVDRLPDGLPDGCRHEVEDGTEGVGWYDGVRREESPPPGAYPWDKPRVTFEWFEHNTARCRWTQSLQTD